MNTDQRENTRLVIESILMTASLTVMFYSILQYNDGKRATDIAQKALDDSKTSGSQTSEANSERFEIEKGHAQAQINALNTAVDELKNQFEIENRPYLSVATADLTFREGVDLKIEGQIENLGKYPIVITQVKGGYALRDVQPDFKKEINGVKKEIQVRWYLTSKRPYINQWPKVKRTITRADLDDVLTRKTKKLYWFGEIEYENLAKKGDEWRYTYAYEIRIYNNSDREISLVYILNENVNR